MFNQTDQQQYNNYPMMMDPNMLMQMQYGMNFPMMGMEDI
jgi:hypothetical protein